MNKFHITNYKIFDSRVRNNFRVLIISDVHYNYYTKTSTLDIILKKIKELSPNYIFIPGDFLDFKDIFYDKSKFLNVKLWFKSVASIAPIFISLGNHELYEMDEEFKKKKDFISLYSSELNDIDNVHFLNNELFTDGRISITGLTLNKDYYGITYEKKKSTRENREVLINELKKLNKAIKTDTDKVNFILIHSPVYLSDTEVKPYLDKYDYVISGHMHNGCVPPILYEIWNSNRGLISPDKRLFVKNARNTLKKKGDKLLVNGPIITFSKHILPLNILNKLFPMYLNIIDFTNDPNFNNKKIYCKKKYMK